MANGYVRFATQPFDASYPSIDKPDTESKFPSGKYEVSGYLDEADDAATLQGLREAVAKAADAEWPGVNIDGIKSPLKVQEDGSVRVTFKSKSKPSTQDASGSALSSDVIIGRGDLIRVAGNAKAYSTAGNKGVTLYLNTVRLIDKRSTDDGLDDPFGGPDEGYSSTSTEEPDF